MDPKQFDAMLSDAEIRLRRLKTLYDQWFMGIERTEPAVPKKELEDLLTALKREHVKNTAAKFRLNTIVQRHVTFTQYWRRIARQIEEGTFKRDLVRARKLKKRATTDDDDDLNYEIDVELDLDMDMDMEAALAEAQEASERTVEPAKAEPAPAPPIAAAAPPVQPAVPPIAAAPRISMPGAPPKLAVPPAKGTKSPPIAAAASGEAPAPAAATAPAVPGKPAPPAVPGKAAPPVPKAVPPAAAAAVAALTSAVGKTPSGAAKAPVISSLKPQAAAAGGSGKPQPIAAGGSGKPQVLHSTKPQAAPHSGKPQPVHSAKPQAMGTHSRAPSSNTEKNGGKPALSSEDVQRIYSNYVAARKQNAERVDNVKLDNIEKTLRGMLPQLEKKHAGKKIDFEVVVKDGKVALKPVAK